MNRTYTPETTLLSPHETHFRTEAWVMNPTEYDQFNNNGEFSVEFEPLTATDYCMLDELTGKWCSEVELRKDPYSRKEVRALVKNKKKFFISSQLFVPKTNVEDIYSLPPYPKASIAGHFRDLPCGAVVINIDYMDFDDPMNGLVEDTTPAFAFVVDENDW